MSIKKHIDDAVKDKYQDLCAKLGDLHFNIKQLNRKVESIEKEIDELNSAYPLIVGYVSQYEKSQEEKSEDQSGS